MSSGWKCTVSDDVECSKLDLIVAGQQELGCRVVANVAGIGCCKCCRKYEESLKYHRQALVLCPHTASILSAMGYTYALTGRYSNAVDCFHKVSQHSLMNNSIHCMREHHGLMAKTVYMYMPVMNIINHNIIIFQLLVVFPREVKINEKC